MMTTKKAPERAGLFSGLSKITGYQPREIEPEKAAPAKASRGNKVGLLTMHDKAVLRQLKTLAARKDTTQQDLVAEALNLLFIKYGEPPIAAVPADIKRD
jgi:hypothetical protein